MAAGAMATTLRALWAVAMTLAAAGDPLFTHLPPDGIPAGWRRSGEARLFAGSALYQHIDGGAELYHQHGFDRLAVQDYTDGVHDVRVEIYRMNGPAGAAAVFAEITAGMTAQKLYGTDCVLDDYQILFTRGPCCVSLTAYENGPESRAGMAALAAAIDAALAGAPL